MSPQCIQSNTCMCSRSRASQTQMMRGRCNHWPWSRAWERKSGSRCSTSRMSCMSPQCIQSNTCMCSRSRASQTQMMHGRCNHWPWSRAWERTSGSRCSTSHMKCMSPQCIQSNTCMCSRSQASQTQMMHGHCNHWPRSRAWECKSGSQCSTSHMKCMSPQCIQSNTCMCSRSQASQTQMMHGRCNHWPRSRAWECTSDSQRSTSRMSCMSPQCIQSNTCMCSRSRASQTRMMRGHCNHWWWCRAWECTSGSRCSTSRMSCMMHHRIQSNTCKCMM